jgi:hypothetical protein
MPMPLNCFFFSFFGALDTLFFFFVFLVTHSFLRHLPFTQFEPDSSSSPTVILNSTLFPFLLPSYPFFCEIIYSFAFYFSCKSLPRWLLTKCNFDIHLHILFTTPSFYSKHVIIIIRVSVSPTILFRLKYFFGFVFIFVYHWRCFSFSLSPFSLPLPSIQVSCLLLESSNRSISCLDDLDTLGGERRGQLRFANLGHRQGFYLIFILLEANKKDS